MVRSVGGVEKGEEGRRFFFFKRKTAYVVSACLVGSEVCIRGSFRIEGWVV